MCRSFTREEIDALRRYKTAHKDNDCWELKSNLRNGIDLEDLPYEQKCIAKLIDSALSKPCPNNKEMTLYRGLRNKLYLTDEEISKSKFRTKDYWGCSTEQTAASNFASAVGGSLLIIRVMPGCRVLNLESSDVRIPPLGERSHPHRHTQQFDCVLFNSPTRTLLTTESRLAHALGQEFSVVFLNFHAPFCARSRQTGSSLWPANSR